MKTKNNNMFHVLSVILFIVFFHSIYTNKTRFSKLNELLMNKYWLISFIVIIVWSLYVLVYQSDSKIYREENQEEAENSTKFALFGFLMSICHHLDMTIWIYWLIWVVSFYLEGWIA
jgi:NADH:ubiquinone oxidoreductase subunit 2 (subunit N)